jgi:hypothetical protein
MKRSLLKSLVLSISTLVGATLAQSVMATDVGAYDLYFTFTNGTPICAVYDVPQADITDVNVNYGDTSVTTDGAGKISGFTTLYITTVDGSANIMANVTGAMGMKGNSPQVKMTLKGTGATASGSSTGKANLNVTFTGAPVYDSVNDQYVMQGTVSGSFNPGIKGVKNTAVKKADAYISNAGGMTEIQDCILSLVAANNKLSAGGCMDPGNGDLYFHPEWSGSGTYNQNGKFSLTFAGTDAGDTPAAGSKVTLKGTAVNDLNNPGNQIDESVRLRKNHGTKSKHI